MLGRILGLLCRFCDTAMPRPRVRVYSVDIDFIASRLERLPNWSWSRWMPLDERYYTVTLEDFERIADWDNTNRHPYYVDRFDCDKYAMHFKSNMAWFFGVNAVAVVVDYSAGHAYNIVFPYDLDRPLIYEAMTDEFIELDRRDESLYAMRDYYVLV